MGKTIWHVTMSVDGFIAGPDDYMDWVFRSSEPSALADEMQEGTGAILGGRRWWDVAEAKHAGVAGIYGGRWSGPVFVLTHHPDDAPQDPAVTVLSGSLAEALAAAREAAGCKNVEVFGANLAQQCLRAGELDEIVIHLAPVLLGEGVRLYGAPGASREVELDGRMAHLRYAVPKSQ
jgi:dihydrofolate reductase